MGRMSPIGFDAFLSNARKSPSFIKQLRAIKEIYPVRVVLGTKDDVIGTHTAALAQEYKKVLEAQGAFVELAAFKHSPPKTRWTRRTRTVADLGDLLAKHVHEMAAEGAAQ